MSIFSWMGGVVKGAAKYGSRENTDVNNERGYFEWNELTRNMRLEICKKAGYDGALYADKGWGDLPADAQLAFTEVLMDMENSKENSGIQKCEKCKQATTDLDWYGDFDDAAALCRGCGPEYEKALKVWYDSKRKGKHPLENSLVNASSWSSALADARRGWLKKAGLPHEDAADLSHSSWESLPEETRAALGKIGVENASTSTFGRAWDSFSKAKQTSLLAKCDCNQGMYEGTPWEQLPDGVKTELEAVVFKNSSSDQMYKAEDKWRSATPEQKRKWLKLSGIHPGVLDPALAGQPWEALGAYRGDQNLHEAILKNTDSADLGYQQTEQTTTAERGDLKIMTRSELLAEGSYCDACDRAECICVKNAGHSFEADRNDPDTCHICGRGADKHEPRSNPPLENSAKAVAAWDKMPADERKKFLRTKTQCNPNSVDYASEMEYRELPGPIAVALCDAFDPGWHGMGKKGLYENSAFLSMCEACNHLSTEDWAGECGACGAKYDGEPGGTRIKNSVMVNAQFPKPKPGQTWDDYANVAMGFTNLSRDERLKKAQELWKESSQCPDCGKKSPLDPKSGICKSCHKEMMDELTPEERKRYSNASSPADMARNWDDLTLPTRQQVMRKAGFPPADVADLAGYNWSELTKDSQDAISKLWKIGNSLKNADVDSDDYTSPSQKVRCKDRNCQHPRGWHQGDDVAGKCDSDQYGGPKCSCGKFQNSLQNYAEGIEHEIEAMVERGNSSDQLRRLDAGERIPWRELADEPRVFDRADAQYALKEKGTPIARSPYAVDDSGKVYNYELSRKNSPKATCNLCNKSDYLASATWDGKRLMVCDECRSKPGVVANANPEVEEIQRHVEGIEHELDELGNSDTPRRIALENQLAAMRKNAKPCPNCGGQGVTELRKCPECRGAKGKTPCPNCGGEGEVSYSIPCPECGKENSLVNIGGDATERERSKGDVWDRADKWQRDQMMETAGISRETAAKIYHLNWLALDSSIQRALLKNSTPFTAQQFWEMAVSSLRKKWLKDSGLPEGQEAQKWEQLDEPTRSVLERILKNNPAPSYREPYGPEGAEGMLNASNSECDECGRRGIWTDSVIIEQDGEQIRQNRCTKCCDAAKADGTFVRLNASPRKFHFRDEQGETILILAPDEAAAWENLAKEFGESVETVKGIGIKLAKVENSLSSPWKCGECGADLQTDEDVKEHKADTGHSNYKGVENASPKSCDYPNEHKWKNGVCSVCKTKWDDVSDVPWQDTTDPGSGLNALTNSTAAGVSRGSQKYGGSK